MTLTRESALVSNLAFAVVLACSTTAAQDQPEEYFVVNNRGSDSIWVQLRATGPGTKDRNWQSHVEIKAGTKQSIRLQGFEPFDIAIHTRDHAIMIAYNQPLCTWMRTVQQTGNTVSEMQFRRGTYVKDDNGKWRIDWPTADAMNSLVAKSDVDKVSIDIGLIGYDPPRKPRIPPKKK